MKLIATTFFVMATAAIVPVAHAADLQAGKATWERLNCASCHGAEAAKATDPSYPILAGQKADYWNTR